MQPAWPALSKEFAISARVHAVDVAASLTLFVAVSLAAGRVWRFAFEDELYFRSVAELSHSTLNFTAFFLNGGDFHPPLAALCFYGLIQLGFADWALRLLSLAMTALSLGLFHLLALAIVRQRSGAAAAAPTRLMAILLFGLSPMALSQGDTIRWYPIFAALFALFIVFTLAGRGAGAKLAAAVTLGLAASTNFLAIFVALAFMLYRYGLQRQFRFRLEAAWWLIVAVLAVPGLISVWSIVARKLLAVSEGVFGFGALQAAAITTLGLSGGDAIGVGNAWIVVPLAAIAPFALAAAIDGKRADDPMHLLLLMLCAIPIMAAAGFAEPRAYLYLTPILSIVLLLFLHRLGLDRGARRALLAGVVILAPTAGAIANVDQSTHPFKRNAVVPFQQIVSFIDANADGKVLVVSSDPVLVWLFQHERARPDLCASYFEGTARCFAPGQSYNSVFVVSGQSNRSRRPEFMRKYQADVARVIAGRQKFATMPAGLDKDAALKSWLTGVPLDTYILTIDLYR